MSSHGPLIGVISDRRELGKHQFHVVGEKYLAALVLGTEAYPVALPTLDFDHGTTERIQEQG